MTKYIKWKMHSTAISRLNQEFEQETVLQNDTHKFNVVCAIQENHSRIHWVQLLVLQAGLRCKYCHLKHISLLTFQAIFLSKHSASIFCKTKTYYIVGLTLTKKILWISAINCTYTLLTVRSELSIGALMVRHTLSLMKILSITVRFTTWKTFRYKNGRLECFYRNYSVC